MLTRDEALALRQVARGLCDWARPRLKQLKKEADLELPFVQDRPWVKAWIQEKLDNLKSSGVRYAKDRVWSMHGMGRKRIKEWCQAPRIAAWLKPSPTYWGWCCEVDPKIEALLEVGFWPISFNFTEDGTKVPVKASEGKLPYPERIKYKMHDIEGWEKAPDADKATIGLAYWSISDRTYHDAVRAAGMTCIQEMHAWYTPLPTSVFRGCGLSKALKPGQILEQESVACFTTNAGYARDIGSRNGTKSKYFYILEVQAGNEACSMDNVYGGTMGENEWRFAPQTSFEVVSVTVDEYKGLPMHKAVIRPVTAITSLPIPYDRAQAIKQDYEDRLFETYAYLMEDN